MSLPTASWLRALGPSPRRPIAPDVTLSSATAGHRLPARAQQEVSIDDVTDKARLVRAPSLRAVAFPRLAFDAMAASISPLPTSPLAPRDARRSLTTGPLPRVQMKVGGKLCKSKVVNMHLQPTPHASATSPTAARRRGVSRLLTSPLDPRAARLDDPRRCLQPPPRAQTMSKAGGPIGKQTVSHAARARAAARRRAPHGRRERSGRPSCRCVHASKGSLHAVIAACLTAAMRVLRPTYCLHARMCILMHYRCITDALQNIGSCESCLRAFLIIWGHP